MAKWRGQAGSQEIGESNRMQQSDRPQPALQGEAVFCSQLYQGGAGEWTEG